MASGLNKLQSQVLKKLLPSIKHSIFNDSTNFGYKCRTMMTIGFNAGFPVNDTFVVQGQEKLHKHRTPLTLKEKEKGDWRNLTLAEKQELYCLSFNQPFCEAIENSEEEWKLILAGAFTAMGLMTLGIYMWLSRTVFNKINDGPMQFHNEFPLKNRSNEFGTLNINADVDFKK